jgi:DMSO/TMAO reductase YedYZ molybdopterin-dependent catalytic subunit
MSTAIKLTHLLVRLFGMAVTVLGVALLGTQNLGLVAAYTSATVALMLAVWTLGLLAARIGVHPGRVALTAVAGIVAPLVSLTGEWPLYVLAGVGALAQSEDLALRMRRRMVASGAHRSVRTS